MRENLSLRLGVPNVWAHRAGRGGLEKKPYKELNEDVHYLAKFLNPNGLLKTADCTSPWP
jgi:hypothetical protein